METSIFATLTRQSGLVREMRVIANNIANSNTTGFRQQGMIFSEYVQRSDIDSSVSMASARIGNTSFAQGTLEQTGSRLDLAIEGDGYFLVETSRGQRLTRAGSFSSSAEGLMVTPDGYPVLDAGGAPLFLPPSIDSVTVGADGTLSAEGAPIGQVGVVRPLRPDRMTRDAGQLFEAADGFDPVENPTVMQGFVEASNVDIVLQMARMVEVQRAYELGQSFMEREDERIRAALESIAT